MWTEYGIDGVDAIRVVVSCVIFFVVVVVMVRVLGPRTLASLSSFDLAALIALGALIGRAILGDSPTLAAGLLGLATLVVLQALTGQLRRLDLGAKIVNARPVVLMAGAELLSENLSRSHVTVDEVHARLRQAGIRDRQEVACVILESTGQISVLRRGTRIDRALLTHVVGAEHIPDEFVAV